MIDISCNDNSLTNILIIVKNALTIIQIIVPILLIIVASIKFFHAMMHPEDKKNVSKIINSFIAAFIVFIIPIIIDAFMYAIGENTSFSSCWNNANEKMENSNIFYEINGGKEKKSLLTDPSEYEKGVPRSSANCPKTVSRTRTTFHSNTFKADTSFSISARQNFEPGNWYTTQAAVYDCQHIIAGQHKSYTVNGVMHKNEGGRVAWFDITTGENVANVSIGKEGTHMARLAYDSDRDVVLVGSVGSDNLIQIDNKTKEIITSPKYATMVGGGSYFIKYDPYNHQLVGLSRNVISYYKYNMENNTYVKTGSVTLAATSKWDPQNFNVDGQVIYIANSNPKWGSSNYAIIVYDMKTGKMLEYHKLDGNVTGGHIEDVIVDTEGNLWLITPAIYWREQSYVAHAYTIGP